MSQSHGKNLFEIEAFIFLIFVKQIIKQLP